MCGVAAEERWGGMVINEEVVTCGTEVKNDADDLIESPDTSYDERRQWSR